MNGIADAHSLTRNASGQFIKRKTNDMNIRLLPRGLTALLCVAAGALSTAASAQTADYPTRPIRILVGFPAGGPVDVAARVIADKLSESLKQPVIVDYHPGANGVIASDMIAKAAPDGYTLLMGASTMAIQASLLKNLPFDTNRDIAQIAIIGQAPLVLVVHPQVPAKSVAELVAMGKAQPGKLTYANPSNGGANHLAAELFKMMSGTDFINVPYKGAAPAETDLIGGHVTMLFGAAPSTLPHVRSGRMRALAISTAKRSPAAPDIPTMAESGYPGFDVPTWYGLMGPARLPKELVSKLNAEVNKALAANDVRERLGRLALDLTPQTPEQFTQFMRSEQTKWAKVIKDAAITAD